MEPVVAASSCVVDEGIEGDEDEYRGDDDDRGVIDVDSVAGPLVPVFRGGNSGDVGTPVGTDTRVEEAADPVAVTGEVSVVTASAWVVIATPGVVTGKGCPVTTPRLFVSGKREVKGLSFQCQFRECSLNFCYMRDL